MSGRVAFAFSPRAIMNLDPDCRKNAFKGRERRVTTRRKSTVKGFSVYASSQRNLAYFVSLSDVAKCQHKNILGFSSRGI